MTMRETCSPAEFSKCSSGLASCSPEHALSSGQLSKHRQIPVSLGTQMSNFLDCSAYLLIIQ